MSDLCLDFGIITKPRPGDQFVSIDGKKTYFEIGPTATPELGPLAAPPPPTRAAVAKPLAGRGEVIGATLKIGGKNEVGRYSGPGRCGGPGVAHLAPDPTARGSNPGASR